MKPESRYASNDAQGYSPAASASAAWGAISSSVNRRRALRGSACSGERMKLDIAGSGRFEEGRLHVGHARRERAGREAEHLERHGIADGPDGRVVVVCIVDRLGPQLDELGRRRAEVS